MTRIATPAHANAIDRSRVRMMDGDFAPNWPTHGIEASVLRFRRAAQLVDDPASTKPVSERIVAGCVGAIEGLCVLLAGLAPLALAAPGTPIDWRAAAPVALPTAALAISLMRVAGAYRPTSLERLPAGLGRALLGALAAILAVLPALACADATPTAILLWLALWSAGDIVALAAVRVALDRLVARWRRTGRLRRRIAVVGAGPVAQRLLRRLAEQDDPGVSVVGIFDDEPARPVARGSGRPVLGSVDDLVEHARIHRVDSVVVAMPLSAERRIDEVLRKLSLVPVDVRLCLDQFGLRPGPSSLTHVAGLNLLNLADRPLQDWARIAKEIEDRVLAALILLLLAPAMLTIALLIKLDSRGPVLFRQKRYGFNNRMIEIFKFRTMYDEARDDRAEQLTRRNDPRVTRLGAFLRRTSLDELPQFLNVLRGDMSVVGPRPHAVAAKAGGLLYRDAVRYYDARHRVKPGITGWAQVNGWRGETETVEQIRKRVEHDLYYIEHWSLLLDVRIILRTVFGGFTGRCAY